MQRPCFYCSKLYGSIKGIVTNQLEGVDFIENEIDYTYTCKFSFNNIKRVLYNKGSESGFEAYFKGDITWVSGTPISNYFCTLLFQNGFEVAPWNLSSILFFL